MSQDTDKRQQTKGIQRQKHTGFERKKRLDKNRQEERLSKTFNFFWFPGKSFVDDSAALFCGGFGKEHFWLQVLVKANTTTITDKHNTERQDTEKTKTRTNQRKDTDKDKDKHKRKDTCKDIETRTKKHTIQRQKVKRHRERQDTTPPPKKKKPFLRSSGSPFSTSVWRCSS